MSVLCIHDFWLFVVAGLLLNITPGPDMLYIAGRTLKQGFAGGLAAIAGISAGCLVHTFAAAVGLSALLMASGEAFTLVKWIGAAYLLYVGITLLLEKPAAVTVAELPMATSRARIFWQGFLTNVLNPKVAVFFLALLPQFIAVQSPNKTLAFVVLGTVFIFNAGLVTLAFAWLVARAGRGIRHGQAVTLWLNRGCGALFVGLGVKLALTDRPA